MNTHPRDIEIIKQIDAYVKGKLNAQQAEELWIDLLKHPEYLDLLEVEITLKALHDDKRDSKKQETGISPLQRSWKWIAAAASVAILVVALNFLTGDIQKTIREFALAEISIANNLAAPPVLRSQQSTLTEADSLLNLGFEAALSGNLNKAVDIYETIIQKYDTDPAVAQAYLNIGVITYNDGEFEPAAKAFEQAIARVRDNALLVEKAYWYLGNAYINLNKLEEAREAIHSAYLLDGIYRKTAFRLLRKLDYELGYIDFDNFEQQIEENQNSEF